MNKTFRKSFSAPTLTPTHTNRQTHIWNSAFGSQHCMNIHHDSFFSVSLEASFDVHHYSYFLFPSTGILLPDSVVTRCCATHSLTAGLPITDFQCKYFCIPRINKHMQNRGLTM